MKRTTLLLSVLLFFLSTAGEAGSGPDSKVLRVRDGKVITLTQMIDEVKKADFVFVGEIHDMMEHHENELAIIRSLHEANSPISVGLEMFRADSQGSLDFWVKRKLSLDQFLPVYYDNWREPWPLYRAIFQYAREHEIPLVGLNIPDRIAAKVARQGFASLTEDERAQLPSGVSCNVDPTYMEFIQRAYAGHGMHGRGFVHFCEAQMVWDKSMAWHLITYLKKYPHRPVVVLAGVGHAWKRGIPEQVGEDSKYTSRVILPLIPDQIDRETVTTNDADYVLLD